MAERDTIDAELARHLGQVVPRRTRQKAHDYVEQGLVDLIETSPERVRATVRGTSRYAVVLELVQVAGQGRWYGRCTCPAFERFGPCKHLWAAAIEAVAGRKVGGSSSASSNPDAGTTGAPAWRRALEEVTTRLARTRRDPWPGVLARARLDWALVERGARVCLEVRVAGANAPVDADWQRLGDELDRAVLARLGSEHSPVGREAVPLDAARAEAVLPLLARAGRLTLRGEVVHHGGDGAARLALRLEPDGRDVRLAAGLVRDGAWMALDEASAWPSIGWAVAEDALVRVAARASDVAVLDVARRGGIAAPAREAVELERLAFEAGLPGLGEQPVEAVPRAVRLEVERATNQAAGDASARISFRYGARWLRASDPVETVRSDDGGARRRSHAAEARALLVFLSAGGRAAPARELAERDGIVPAACLDAVLGEALEQEWELLLTGLPARLPDEIAVRAREEAGELVLEGHVRFGARKLSLDELLAGREHGRIELADGTTALLPGALRRSLQWAAQLGHARGGSVRLDARRGWLAAPLLAGLGAALPDSVAHARATFQDAHVDEVATPRGLIGELRAYQRAGLAWFDRLERLGLGGCLADDMGLGKTVQVLARLVQRKERGLSEGASLVVAPRSVLHHWEQQAARFAPGLSVATHSGTGRDLDAALAHDLVLVTYGTLRQDASAFARARFDVVVLDESQAIKNAASQTAAAARGLEARARLALSGTPVENHLGELAALMSYLNPGLLGASGAALAKLRDERSARDLLHALAPVFLRRTKSAVLAELPPRTETTLWCELEGAQSERYEALRQHARSELLGEATSVRGERTGTVHVLAHLTRLRQAACHVGLVDPALAGVASAKFDALLPRLEQLAEEGRKALVFSQFASLLRLLPRDLESRGLGWELLDGETRNRAARVQRFQTDASVSVFLISLKAGGTGLDLTAADTIFLLDPWWNPAAERQAIDRAHRIGQTKPVFAYRLVARGTVEERVAELAAGKGALLEELFASDKLGRIDRETLQGLL